MIFLGFLIKVVCFYFFCRFFSSLLWFVSSSGFDIVISPCYIFLQHKNDIFGFSYQSCLGFMDKNITSFLSFSAFFFFFVQCFLHFSFLSILFISLFGFFSLFPFLINVSCVYWFCSVCSSHSFRFLYFFSILFSVSCI